MRFSSFEIGFKQIGLDLLGPVRFIYKMIVIVMTDIEFFKFVMFNHGTSGFEYSSETVRQTATILRMSTEVFLIVHFSIFDEETVGTVSEGSFIAETQRYFFSLDEVTCDGFSDTGVAHIGEGTQICIRSEGSKGLGVTVTTY